MNIVLYEPEKPENTGNIGRTCAATGTALHLIRPFGFILNDKHLRRAGMDYWHSLVVKEYDDFDDFIAQNKGACIYMASTKAINHYAEPEYKQEDFIMFGKESAGIPEEILVAYKENAIRIPMLKESRSLNLSCAVSIILYEALRQQDFCGLEAHGQLHRLSWQ